MSWRLIFMKKKIILAGSLILIVTLGLAALFLRVTRTSRAPQAQAEVKELRERVKHLEEITAALEKKLGLTERKKHANAVTHATFTPDGKLLVTTDDQTERIWRVPDGEGTVTPVVPLPAQPAPSPNSPSFSVPPGWKPHEFNGMTYYLVPLATRGEISPTVPFAP